MNCIIEVEILYFPRIFAIAIFFGIIFTKCLLTPTVPGAIKYNYIKIIITKFVVDKFNSLDNQKQSSYTNNVLLTSLNFEIQRVLKVLVLIILACFL